MKLVASDEVRAYVESHGGVLYVTALRHKCCSGALTTLDTSTEAPADPTGYRDFDSGEFPLRLRSGSVDEPEELVVEMKGVRRRRPVAYWNGCAFKI